MEYIYFVVIVIIVMKILFWTVYFYVRSQRLRQMRAPPRFIIIGGTAANRRSHPYDDRSAIVNHAEGVSVTAPPPYSETDKDAVYAPPPYEQAAGYAPTTHMTLPSGYVATGSATVPPPSAYIATGNATMPPSSAYGANSNVTSSGAAMPSNGAAMPIPAHSASAPATNSHVTVPPSH